MAEGQMTRTRKLVAFLIYAAMIGGGIYLLAALDDAISTHHKFGVMAAAAAVVMMVLGSYLLWVDIIAPALGVKTQEEAWETEDEARKRRVVGNETVRLMSINRTEERICYLLVIH
jgi:hypothetical protein